MTSQTTDRRTFLKAGALIAPIVAAPAAAAIGEDGTQARLARLADEAGIAAAHRAWLRAAVTPIHVEPHAEPSLAFAAGGVRATGRYACTVETETLLPADSTFAQMAQLQGGGRVVVAERKILVTHYEKVGGAWRVSGTELLPA